MKFYMKIWLSHYTKAKGIGRKLNNHLSDVGEGYITYDKELVKRLEKDVLFLTNKCATYLNECGLTLPPPKWRYDSKDESTWFSSPNFKHTNLL